MAVFRARARSVDMLGRQQIAGAATAISEIFKNAHDAYASMVRADLLLGQRCLIIRDDGVGMTPHTFEQAWLTLATDAKVGRPPVQPPKGMTHRPVLGAKGIGRLAIAVVGPHVLVMTRSQHSELVVALVNWSAFELPGVDLDEVEVPVRLIDGGSLPTPSDIKGLVDISVENVRRISHSKATAAELVESLRSFNINAADAISELEGPQLSGSGHGTQFVISPVSDELVRQAGSDAADSEITLELSGFANTMTPGHDPPSIRTSLWLHQDERPPIDILAESEFLTTDEFLSADHHVIGSFDESGRFVGSVSVYGRADIQYSLPWQRAIGPTRCGPFGLAFAIIQGNSSDSVLSGSEHQRLSRKLARMGGIYVYREGIRVLPYGRPDFDWLGIEQRRTMSLAKAFYSHRRLFGAVSISNERNHGLQEKAGREGFQQNAAYRDLRGILQDFLQQSASDFFVVGGAESEPFVVGRTAVQRGDAARREAERRKQELERQRRSLAAQIARAYLMVTDGEAAEEVRRAVGTFEARVKGLRAGEGVDALEVEEYRAASRLGAVRRMLDVEVPAELGLTRELKRDLAALEAARADFDSSVLAPARLQLDQAARSVRPTEPVNIDVSAIVRQSEFRLRSDEEVAESLLRSSIERLQGRVDGLVDSVRAHVTSAVTELITSCQSVSRDAEHYVFLRVELEERLEGIYNDACQTLTTFASSLDDLHWFQQDGEIVTSSSVLAVLDEEIADLRDAADQSIDLVQQGMALAIVDHEFQLIVTELRRSLRELSGWADLNTTLRPLYDRMSASFEHLDGFLTLFTPLQRRMNTRPTRITGAEIYAFIDGLFSERMSEGKIQLVATNDFLAFNVRGYRSTWYPVFVNLVDNAMYWVSQARPPRAITLDRTSNGINVRDSGPGVRQDDQDMIWESRFSRRPGGRGLGLTVAREVLRREGFELVLDRANDVGASFLIRKAGSFPDSRDV